MNRKQRRALQSRKNKKPAGITKATQSIEKAVAKLEKVGDLDDTLGELHTIMAQTQVAMGEVNADVEMLMAELERQREVNIRLLTILLGPAVQRNLSEWSEEDLARVRALEGTLREQTTPPQDGQ